MKPTDFEEERMAREGDESGESSSPSDSWRPSEPRRTTTVQIPRAGSAADRRRSDTGGLGTASAPSASGPPGRKEQAPELDVVSIAIELWRMQSRLRRTAALLPPKDARPLQKSVERLGDLLAASGVSVDDPVNRPYVEGERLDVLLFEPQHGLERPRVLQTVKPSVFRDGVCVRAAQVIVGVPSESDLGEEFERDLDAMSAELEIDEDEEL